MKRNDAEIINSDNSNFRTSCWSDNSYNNYNISGVRTHCTHSHIWSWKCYDLRERTYPRRGITLFTSSPSYALRLPSLLPYQSIMLTESKKLLPHPTLIVSSRSHLIIRTRLC